MNLKYLIVSSIDDIPVPVIFSELLQHRDCVPEDTVAISGGYVKLQHGKAVCYSQSISLNLKPGADDAAIIESYLHP